MGQSSGHPLHPKLSVRTSDPEDRLTDDGLLRSVRVKGRFSCPWEHDVPRLSLVRLMKEPNHNNIPSKAELDKTLPVLTPDLSAPPPARGIRATWIGHATLLVQMDSVTVLTDPLFSQRASPVTFAGPRRYRDTPCRIADLPRIDAVVISHNHYDHLDLRSVKALNTRFGAALRWFVPLGVASWMYSVGVESVTEMDWWDEEVLRGQPEVTGHPEVTQGQPEVTQGQPEVTGQTEVTQGQPEVTKGQPEVKVVFTPTQHWSKRGLADDRKTLWGSWCVLGPSSRFHFVGDSGYCEAFKQIGQKYGPFDLAAIPIGPVEPRWLMAPSHVDPPEAVQAHIDLRAKKSVAIHWGTLKTLAKEFYLSGREQLPQLMRDQGLKEEDFITIKHGETLTIEGH